jgi:hypothetical protein
MSQPSSQGRRQERRGPHTASALPGRGVAARARPLARTRAAATELALDSPPISCEDDTKADPRAALLLRVEPASANGVNRGPAPQAAQGAAGLKGQRERGYVNKRFALAFGLRPSHHLHDNGKGSAFAVA